MVAFEGQWKSMDAIISIELEQVHCHCFEARFDDPAIAPLRVDLPAPAGGGAGPDPTRLLGVAIAECLASSLLQALREHGNEAVPLRALASVGLARDAQRQLRVAQVAVDLHLGAPADALHGLQGVLDHFGARCVVTESLRRAFPIDVRVLDARGTTLKLTRSA